VVAAQQSKPSSSPLGLIAGDGQLPIAVAHAARAAGHEVCAIGYHGITDPALGVAVDRIDWLHLGEFEALLERFVRSEVNQVVLAGKVSKQHLYGDVASLRPDARALDVISRLKDRRDDSLLDAIAGALGEEGIGLRSQLDFCGELVSAPGVLGAVEPTPAQWEDIRFGWPIARAMGGLDIGQSVVVESRAVLAVEAIEGTDEAIRRGGALGSGEPTLIKVSKPDQDPRFDLPTVGQGTLEAMCESGVRVLAIEAHCTIILERELLLRIADANGVAVVAVADPDRSGTVG
jgi:hypothetical protein